jgi:hypothetical protein
MPEFDLARALTAVANGVKDGLRAHGAPMQSSDRDLVDLGAKFWEGIGFLGRRPPITAVHRGTVCSDGSGGSGRRGVVLGDGGGASGPPESCTPSDP